jgi:hypothetical protein
VIKKNTQDITTSVHQRLLNKARELGRPFNELFQYFSMERFIYRLSKTPPMIKLGELNSRMKDFYDIWFLSKQFDFNGHVLAEAITKTFKIRKTEIPAQPSVFKKSFSEDQTRETQWTAFLRKTVLANTPHSFYEVMTEIKSFLVPVSSSIVAQKSFQKKWKAPGPWK